MHQILSLLKLDSLNIQELEKLGDPLKAKIITERMLRPYANTITLRINNSSQYFKTLLFR